MYFHEHLQCSFTFMQRINVRKQVEVRVTTGSILDGQCENGFKQNRAIKTAFKAIYTCFMG